MVRNQPTSVRFSKETLEIIDWLSKQYHNVGRRVIIDMLVRGEIDIKNVSLPPDLEQYLNRNDDG